MKKLIIPIILLAGLLASCKKDQCEQTQTYWKYTPRYRQISDIVQDVKTMAPTPLKNTGKIFLTGHYILINEYMQGIHVIDNANPSAPLNVAFINIPGNIDMAVKDNILYADCYTALIALNISDPSSPSVANTVYDALPPLYTSFADGSSGVLTGYDSARVTEKVPCASGGPVVWMEGDWAKPMNSAASTGSATANVPSTPNIAGSTSRFAIDRSALYIVDQSALRVFNISNAAAPVSAGSSQIGWNIETIFAYQSHLYIGTSTGMQIFNLNSPFAPQHDATFTHALSCDPVIVQDHYAYVTLHSGTTCNNSVNELEVVDVSNTTAPTIVATYPLHSPRGLSIDGATLFICDGDEGLKVFDAGDVRSISSHSLGQFGAIQSQDVIAWNKTLLMIGTNGLYEYDYSDPQHITPLGHIAIAR
ncbi:MAG: hypothetical protein JST83_06270 [Bacteroidetes bacterium]|nr:hypothetical protein [Bacteroidota bacterium]